jgi:hypothetical protein
VVHLASREVVRRRADGTVEEIPPVRCPNDHPVTHPNVIVGWWPAHPGNCGRAWHCLTCKATIYDD